MADITVNVTVTDRNEDDDQPECERHDTQCEPDRPAERPREYPEVPQLEERPDSYRSCHVQDPSHMELVNQGCAELLEIVGDDRYDAYNLIRLAAIGVSITMRMVNVTNRERKTILISMIEKFLELRYAQKKLSRDEYNAALDSLGGLEDGIDVLFDFRKGKYDAESVAKVAVGRCMFMTWLAMSRKPRVVYENRDERRMRKEFTHDQKTRPQLKKKR